MPYKLSASLTAHTADVKCVASPTDNLILSASRDTTAISWTRSLPAAQFDEPTVYKASARYVNAVAYIHPPSETHKGFVVVGGQDCLINVFELGSGTETPNYTLVGHSGNVCALHATASGTIISGSWDKTARVWRNFQLLYELKGHSHSVLAVLAFDEDTFLTGSADKSIKLWNKNKVTHTFTGHTDAVRGLTLVPDLGFASCSNDSEIRVWTTQGDLIYSLSGHTSFVYSVSILPNGDLVSAGEDRTIRIWRDGECAETLVHPAISVWSVSTMPNGDIVSGSSDGIVRVFSAAQERWATQEELSKYDEQVSSQALPSQQVGDLKTTDLPGPEALNTPGSKAGEQKLIKNGDKVEVYHWDTSSASWQKIGDVVDAVGSQRKQLYEGKEYDYVFEVDVQEGAPKLKLPYNANENPFTAAQRFLNANDLPMSHLDEVARFIEQQTGGVNLSAGNEFVDPFTGASRYRATASGQSSSGSGAYGDPFTGGNRYQPAAPQAPASQQPPVTALSDPFTGGGRYTPSSSLPPQASQPFSASSQSAAPRMCKILPLTSFHAFKQGEVRSMRNRLDQFNDGFQHEITTSHLALFPEETKALDEATTYLASPTAAGASAPTFDHIENILHIAERWPSSQRFPLIDLLRLISGFCLSAYSGPGQASKFFTRLFQAAEWDAGWEQPPVKSRDLNRHIALRALANGVQEGALGSEDWLGPLLEHISNVPYLSMNPVQRTALATLLFNISCVRLQGSLSSAATTSHLSLVARVLTEEKTDAETAYRALAALGNVTYSGTRGGVVLPEAQAGEVRRLASECVARFPAERFRNLRDDITGLV